MSEGLTPGDPLGSPTPAPPNRELPGIPGSYTSPPPPGAGGPAPTGVPGATGQQVLAGWGRRAAAFIVDALIISAVAAALVGVFGIGFASVDSDAGIVALAGAAIVSLLVFALVALLYAPLLMWRTNGKTIGRMAAGIRVVRANGQDMDFGTAMMREVVIKALAVGIASSIIPLLPFLIDVLWPLWDDENRALHDFPVNTRTVLD
jgi:uncharacterized RDD family membrane protein YckC